MIALIMPALVRLIRFAQLRFFDAALAAFDDSQGASHAFSALRDHDHERACEASNKPCLATRARPIKQNPTSAPREYERLAV